MSLRQLVCLAVLLCACSPNNRPPGRSDGGGVDAGPTMCTPGGPSIVCRGPTLLRCNGDGTVGSMESCADMGLTCAPGLGCRTCAPGRPTCEGNSGGICRADGSGFDITVTCDPMAGETCNPASGSCSSPCADAIASNSYIGCEYWPVATLNSQIATEFEFAVVVANPQTAPAMVTITRNGTTVTNQMVPAGGVSTIRLPWVPELKGTFSMEASALVRGGAYRLTSSLPVTVYQFNALDYRIARDCLDEPDPFPDGQCFSYTNDASLLLPTHVLTGNYMVMSWPAMALQLEDPFFGDTQMLPSPGYMAIVGADAAPVNVTVNFAGRVQASLDGVVGSFGPGSSGTWSLNQGDVLQIVTQAPPTCAPGSPSEARPGDGAIITYCNVGPEYDLTGSTIQASGRVAVVSGHNCTFVPANRWACDHIEEQMFPLESWGKDIVLSASQPLRGEPNLVRIISGRDGNTITLDPAPAGVPASSTLNRGQLLQFETRQDVRIVGSEAIMVAQFLVGQDYGGIGLAGEGGEGDPSLSLGIPTEQFRTSYSFLAPDTYTRSYVNITASAGQNVILDGSPVSGWTPVGTTGMQTTRVMISGGAHNISSDLPFGIVVYGFGSYTSYMYPGGLDLEMINPLI